MSFVCFLASCTKKDAVTLYPNLGNDQTNVTSDKSMKLPKLNCMPSHHMEGAKKWKNYNMQNWGSAARCVHKTTSRRNNHQNLSPRRSRSRWCPWIFCFVHTAHAIWAWKGIYGVIWPFEFKSFGITMRSHIQHMSLEAPPSEDREKIYECKSLFLFL